MLILVWDCLLFDATWQTFIVMRVTAVHDFTKESQSTYVWVSKAGTAILQKWVPYSQRYLVLGLVGLALWLVSGIALNKHRCE